MVRCPQRFTRSYTLFPYTALFRSLRGLHYQWPKPQGKYMSVLDGEVWDVAVDIRRGSPTFGKWEAILLTAENRRHFWIPEGFAHRSEEHTSELQSLMRISYAVFCLKKKTNITILFQPYNIP